MAWTMTRINSAVNNNYSRYLIHCKRYLKEVLSSGVLGAEAASLDIVELIPGDKYAKIDVNCKLPVYNGSNKPSIKQTPTALAFHIQQYMNSGSSELRSLLHKGYPKMKIPVFQFFITEQTCIVNAPSIDSEHLQSSNDVVFTAIPASIKPNNVYGLERDKLVKIINSRLKAIKKKSHTLEPRNLISDNYEEINITPESIKQDHTSISAWAKYWKESQDWRAIAKRDRRLRHQSTGLEFLTHNQNKSSDVEN
ncbi:unnamed protein product [Schistosoma margrebowiei]|uniref:SWIB domain-containing protein n=1 Tax=Schistosoma margrebowiei TaxID=48269 RepID=A0AA85ALK2_9TREM|nr:unnamed protein product [Schistosoma margrebowiei]